MVNDASTQNTSNNQTFAIYSWLKPKCSFLTLVPRWHYCDTRVSTQSFLSWKFESSCTTCLSVGWCKKDVNPVRWQWSYVFNASTLRCTQMDPLICNLPCIFLMNLNVVKGYHHFTFQFSWCIQIMTHDNLDFGWWWMCVNNNHEYVLSISERPLVQRNIVFHC